MAGTKKSRTQICIACGAGCVATARFCSGCGAPLDSQDDAAPVEIDPGDAPTVIDVRDEIQLSPTPILAETVATLEALLNAQRTSVTELEARQDELNYQLGLIALSEGPKTIGGGDPEQSVRDTVERLAEARREVAALGPQPALRRVQELVRWKLAMRSLSTRAAAAERDSREALQEYGRRLINGDHGVGSVAPDLQGQIALLAGQSRQIETARQELDEVQISHDLMAAELAARAAEVRDLGVEVSWLVSRIRAGLPGFDVPVPLKRDEIPYFAQQAMYASDKTSTHYEGASAGVSFRVARGVSIRAGGSRGVPIQQQYLAQRGVGVLALTNQRVIFAGTPASTSLRLVRIVNYELYTDGFAIFEEGREARKVFLMDQPAVFLACLEAALTAA